MSPRRYRRAACGGCSPTSSSATGGTRAAAPEVYKDQRPRSVRTRTTVMVSYLERALCQFRAIYAPFTPGHGFGNSPGGSWGCGPLTYRGGWDGGERECAKPRDCRAGSGVATGCVGASIRGRRLAGGADRRTLADRGRRWTALGWWFR